MDDTANPIGYKWHARARLDYPPAAPNSNLDIMEERYYCLLALVSQCNYEGSAAWFEEQVLNKLIEDGLINYVPAERFYTITEAGVQYVKDHIYVMVEACCLSKMQRTVYGLLELLDVGELARFLVHNDSIVRKMSTEIVDERTA